MTKLSIVARDADTHLSVFRVDYEFEVGQTASPDISELSRYRRVDIEFVAHFGSAVVRASANVAKVANINITQPDERRIEATVEHKETEGIVAYARAAREMRDCLLHCPDTGIRSPGPCIDCSDGEYTIRLCC